MRFLHTADWQIGMKAVHAGPAGRQIREARIVTARRVVEIAVLEGAEFMVLAGDTFESNAVDRATVQRVGDILAGFGRPVYLLPGNHDPIETGSVWEHPVWSSHRNLLVLRDAAPVATPGGVLFPCPVADRTSTADPTGWIPASGGGIRIGLAHGSIEGGPADPSLPIPRNAAARAGLDYLALGHWHSIGECAARMWYSGTPEPTGFDERDSGNVLLVEISGPGATPEVRRIPAASLVWERVERDIRAAGQLRRLREEFEAMPGSPARLIEVRAGGLLFAAEAGEPARIREILGSRFLYGRLDDFRLAPAPEDDEWVTALPEGFLQDAARRLCEAARGDADARRRAVAGRALLELFRLDREVTA